MEMDKQNKIVYPEDKSFNGVTYSNYGLDENGQELIEKVENLSKDNKKYEEFNKTMENSLKILMENSNASDDYKNSVGVLDKEAVLRISHKIFDQPEAKAEGVGESEANVKMDEAKMKSNRKIISDVFKTLME